MPHLTSLNKNTPFLINRKQGPNKPLIKCINFHPTKRHANLQNQISSETKASVHPLKFTHHHFNKNSGVA